MFPRAFMPAIHHPRRPRALPLWQLVHQAWDDFLATYEIHHRRAIVPPPPKVTARAMRPLWRDLILRVWGADPLQCPCCQATMQCAGTIVRPGEIQFFLRLHGLWDGVIDLPPPPDPPFDIETFEPIEPPWQAIREWIPDDDAEPSFDFFDQRPASGKPVEIPREDGSILVLDPD